MRWDNVFRLLSNVFIHYRVSDAKFFQCIELCFRCFMWLWRLCTERWVCSEYTNILLRLLSLVLEFIFMISFIFSTKRVEWAYVTTYSLSRVLHVYIVFLLWVLNSSSNIGCLVLLDIWNCPIYMFPITFSLVFSLISWTSSISFVHSYSCVFWVLCSYSKSWRDNLTYLDVNMLHSKHHIQLGPGDRVSFPTVKGARKVHCSFL